VSKIPEALRLADELEDCRVPMPRERKAAAELRHLHAVNQELLEALKELLAMPDYDGSAAKSVTRHKAKRKARAAIAKAEEVKP